MPLTYPEGTSPAKIHIRRYKGNIPTEEILEDGQPAYSVLTNELKVGNGIDTFNNLPLANVTGVSTGDANYTHTQSEESATWNITHNLNKFPSVTIVDSAGSVVEGNITHLSTTQTTISFTAPFSGKAYFN